jgi:hypothetical protein
MAKNFILKSFIFIALITGSVELLFRFNPYRAYDFEHDYSATIIDKHNRLKSLKSPKIVLIAGSNYAYGINSELIEKAFNRPVVNMAIHYSLGSDFMLRQLEDNLQKGDIVIMGFEYIVDSKGDTNEKLLAEYYYPEASNWIQFDSLIVAAKARTHFRVSTYKKLINRLLRRGDIVPSVEDTTSYFFRRGINQYGDLISHLNNPPLRSFPDAKIDTSTSMKSAIKDMNQFTIKMAKKGVKCYYSYPCFGQYSYKEDAAALQKIDKELRTLGKFEILGKMQDFIYPDSLLQDMVFHLNTKGREVHTHKVIDLLKTENGRTEQGF